MIFKSYLVEKNINSLEKDLVLFYGENLGLINEFKNIIRQGNLQKEIILLNQDEILKKIDKFFADIFNISLFDKEKIFFINQSNDKIFSIIEELEGKLKGQKIYFFSDILDKKSKLRSYFEKSNSCAVIPCYADNEIGIKKIILEKLRGFEGLTPENINLIVDNCGLDRIKLNNEIDKITAFYLNKKLETISLRHLLNDKINDDFNILRDEAFLGNKIKTNKLLGDTVMDSDKIIYYLNVINQRLIKINEVRNLSKTNNFSETIEKLRPPIFWKEKPNFLMQVQKWTDDKIDTTIKETISLEIKIKSNSIVDKTLILKKLIVDLCSRANA